MRRYLEALFSHKLLFLTPLVVIPAIVIAGALTMGGSYEVEARIWVDDEPLLAPDDLGMRPLANEREAQALQEWLSTKAFRLEVLDRAGLGGAIENAEWPKPGGIRSWPVVGWVLSGVGLVGPITSEVAQGEALHYVERSVNAESRGNNLVIVSYDGAEAVIGAALVDATIAAYRERSTESLAQKSELAVRFYEERVQELGMKVTESAQELQDFLVTHPLGFFNEPRPPDEQLELDELQRQYDLNRTLYETALDRLEQARAAGEAGQEVSFESFLVIDTPEVPQSSTFTRRTVLMMAIGGLGGGVGLGVLLIVLVTLADGTVRTSDDLARLSRCPVLGMVPEVKPGDKKSSRGGTKPNLGFDIVRNATEGSPQS